METTSNLTTILLIGVAVAVLAWPIVRARLGGGSGIPPAAVKARIDSGEPIVVVDIRSAREAGQTGRVPGSLLAPMGELTRHVPELRRRSPDDGRGTVVVVCRSGARAAAVVPVLRAAGFRDVAVLRGGILAWRRAGFPVE